MREMKDSGIEWIGEIPNDWDVSKIKFVADFEPTCNFENVSPEDRIAYAPMECIKQGFYEARDAQYEELSHSLTPFQNGDIVMAKVTPCFENGNIAIMNELPSGIGLGSSELFVFRAKNIVAKYLFYWLQNSDFIQRACSTMTGVGGLKRVSPFFCKNCEIHIPPYNEQGRIADYLDRKCSQIDAIIARQQEVLEKLKAYKLSIITEAVTKGLNPDVPMKDSGVEWIGKVPGDWTKVKLKNICQFINGDRSSNYPSPNEYVDDGIPFLGADSLCGRYVDITQSKKITKEKYQSMGGAKIQEGDILYTLRGSTIGKNAMATFDEGTVASSLMVIRPISLIPEYLLYWLNSEEEFQQRQSCINGSTAPNLSAENVGSFVMFLPSALEQRKIADYLDTKCAEIELTMLKKQVLVDQLGNYKKSLIYEVVTGKKEV